MSTLTERSQAKIRPLAALAGFAEAFHDAATRAADEAAFVGETACTYRQLETRVGELADRLRELGVEPGRRVCCSAELAADRVALALAVLDTGGSPVIAPGHPPPTGWNELLGRQAVATIAALDASGLRCERNPTACADYAGDGAPGQIGSIGGRGRGIRISFSGARRFLRVVVETLHLGGVAAHGRIVGWNDLSNDLGLYELWAALCTESTLILPSGRELDAVASACRRHRPNAVCGAPRRLARLLSHNLWPEGEESPTSAIFLARDQVPIPVVRRIRNLNPKATVVALFGTSELAPWSLAKAIAPGDEIPAAIVYDHLLGGMTAAVRGPGGRRCPLWVPGELHLGDDEPAPGATGFGTGEIGRFVGAGRLEVLGRVGAEYVIDGVVPPRDAQENWLARNAGVEEAWLSRDQGGRPVAYLATASPALDLSALCKSMSAAFSGRPVPRLEVLPSIPLDFMGRADVAEPKRDGRSVAPAAPPVAVCGPWEERIGVVVTEVLKRRLEPNQNFHQSGVDSVEFIALANRLERVLGARLPFERLFAEPTIAAIAAFYRSAAALAEPPRPSGPGQLIIDPVARDAFKQGRPARQQFEPGRPRIPLAAGQDAWLLALRRRRTRREFGGPPVPLAAIARLLSLLMEFGDGVAERRLYPSAGGLYPVQTYLECRPGRVAGLDAGCYYFDPIDGALVRLSDDVAGPAVHFEINRPAAESAALALYFVAALDAIRPLYGEAALGFCLYESGAMGQLLALEGAGLGLGFCNIGGLMDAEVRRLLALAESQVLIHTIVAGPVEGVAIDRRSAGKALRSDGGGLVSNG